MSRRRVSDLMTSGTFAVLPDDDLLVLHRLMKGWRVRHAPVVDEAGIVLGVVSQRDLLRHTQLGRPDVSEDELEENLRGMRTKDILSAHVETVTPETPLREAARRLFDGQLGCLVVVDDRMHLRGILTESDFVRRVARHGDAGDEDRSRLVLGALAGVALGAPLGAGCGTIRSAIGRFAAARCERACGRTGRRRSQAPSPSPSPSPSASAPGTSVI